jgi:eukaryotic-like serine/threonine-protein kinase
MNPEPNNPKTIFLAAVDKTNPAERAAFLDEACGADTDLRRRVEALLRAHDDPGRFLEPAAPEQGGTADAGLLTERPGTCIGPYKLVQQIGEGGMGVVYIADQAEPVKRRVALKIIKPGLDSEHVIHRFEAERQALAMMDHTNIARVFDAGTTAAGRPYFVMELVKGVPITKYCDELHLSLRDRLELFVPVCQAVQHAHLKGIIHRDLKPTNVLVAMEEGRPVPKVIDFGVAKALHQPLTERTLVTEFGAIVGTLEYMSPEQAELSALDIDTRADLYSLGVLLYELLTGTTPLTRARLKHAALDELLRVIRDEEPPKPSTRLTESKESLPDLAARRRTGPARLAREVRGELDWIVMKCLEKDRTRRYDGATGLARDVQRYLADEAVEACPPSAAYRFRKFARKHRAALLTATTFAALLIMGVVISAWQALRARQAEAAALEQRDAAEQERQRAEDAERAARTERDRATAEGQRADEQAAAARAVNEFLQHDLLGQAKELERQPSIKKDANR